MITDDNLLEKEPTNDKNIEPTDDQQPDDLSLQRAKQELEESADDLKRIDTNELSALLERLSSALSGTDNDKILRLMFMFDQSAFMATMRNWWNRRSSFLQKCLYNSNLFPHFRLLTDLGFLELKGVSEKQLEQKWKRRLTMQKWAFNILMVIKPEVAKFKPLVDILARIEKKHQSFSQKSRPYLVARRLEEQNKTTRGAKRKAA